MSDSGKMHEGDRPRRTETDEWKRRQSHLDRLRGKSIRCLSELALENGNSYGKTRLRSGSDEGYRGGSPWPRIPREIPPDRHIERIPPARSCQAIPTFPAKGIRPLSSAEEGAASHDGTLPHSPSHGCGLIPHPLSVNREEFLRDHELLYGLPWGSGYPGRNSYGFLYLVG